jgi:GTP-binding protein
MNVIAAELAASCASPRDFPTPDAPEVALLGRSNVGKSSLLNRLAGRRRLARTSSTPGKTRLIHFYRLVLRDAAGDRSLVLVDLPGYGYARVSRTERAAWQALVESYLEARPTLRAAVLLQDLRRDVSDEELDLLAWLEGRGRAPLVALTKADKLPPMQRSRRVRELTEALGLVSERVIATSAETGLGIEALLEAIQERVG